MSIGENIKNLREARGLTQAQLGDAVGVSDKAVSTWESGKREPRMGVVEKLAAFFGVEKSTLLFGDNDHFYRPPGGFGTSSYLVDALMSDPPSRKVVEPILEHYGAEKTAADEGDGLSPLEKRLMQLVQRLSDDQKEMLLAQIELLLSKQG